MRKSIFKATVLVFILSLAGKGIGFLKSMIIASSFGASNMTDIYYMAEGVIANIFYAVTMSVSVAFLPMYIKKKEEGGVKKSYQFSTRVVTGLGLLSLLLTVFLIVVAPILVKIMAPSYSEIEKDQTALFLRIMSLGILFSLMANIFQNVLNAEKVYEFAAFSSIVNSLVLIGMVFCFQDKIGIMSLVFAMPLSYLIQFLFLKLRTHSYVGISVKFGIWGSEVKELLGQSLPILLSNTTIEINQLVDRMLLLSIEEGAVTALSYSAVLFQFAAHIISLPLSTISFTEVSLACAQKNEEKVQSLLNTTVRTVVIICVPVIIVIFNASESIVNLVYGHGLFSMSAVGQAGRGLAFYAFCLIPYCLKRIVTQAFYSVQETKIPMLLGIFEVIMNIAASIILSRIFGVAGVVMGTALASTVFSAILLLVFSWKEVNLGIRKMGYLLKYATIAGILFLLARICPINSDSFWGLCAFSSLIFVGYAILLLIFRDRLFLTMVRGLQQKMKGLLKK
jgi:putative peptidoglycan lipid II flippase